LMGKICKLPPLLQACIRLNLTLHTHFLVTNTNTVS
jgi:hypothetical protein